MRFDNGWVHGLEGLEDFGTGEFGMLFFVERDADGEGGKRDIADEHKKS